MQPDSGRPRKKKKTTHATEMTVDDLKELRVMTHRVNYDLLILAVKLGEERPTWYQLRGHQGLLLYAYDQLLHAVETIIMRRIARSDLQPFDATTTSVPSSPLSHHIVQEWLLALGKELSRWEEKLRQNEKTEVALDRFQALLRQPVDQEKYLSFSAPEPPGDFCTRLDLHRTRSSTPSYTLHGSFHKLAQHCHDNRYEKGDYYWPSDGHPVEFYRRQLADDYMKSIFDNAWVFFMIPGGQWVEKKTHRYFPLHVRMEVCTLLQIGALKLHPTQYTLASLPVEMQHCIASFVASGRGAERRRTSRSPSVSAVDL